MAYLRLPRPALAVRLWWLWIAITLLSHSLFAWTHPELLTNQAYDLSYEILPLRAWGVVNFFAGIGFVVGFFTRKSSHGMVATVMSTPFFLLTAVSIGALTFQGFEAAIIAVFLWLTPLVGNLLIIMVANRPHLAQLFEYEDA